MKYIPVLLLALLLQGCDYFNNHIEFEGTAPGISNGSVSIKGPSGKTIFSAAIQNGKFHILKQQLKMLGYYKLTIVNNDTYKLKRPGEFEIYLEPGEYTINTARKGLSDYPFITSSSKIQNELSAYYPMADSVKYTANIALNKLSDQMKDPKLNGDAYNAVVDKFKAAQITKDSLTANVLGLFLSKYPQSEVVAHLMAATDYESSAVASYKLYQKFSAVAKNSDDGTEIGDKLSHMVKMLPGLPAPQLVGKTPDGKSIDIKALHKKVILVEFWEAGITLTRKRHMEMVNKLLPSMAGKGFEIVSVSLDDKRDWWTSAIKDDKMTWPQVCDGKGLKSANLENWGVAEVPYYCLLNGDGQVIESNVEYSAITSGVNDYLSKHPASK